MSPSRQRLLQLTRQARRGVQGYRVWHVRRRSHLRTPAQDRIRARLLPGRRQWLLLLDGPRSRSAQVSNDFGSYIEAQKLVDELWGGDHSEWDKRSIRTSFAMGEFSSDRSVQDYADGIWSGESLLLRGRGPNPADTMQSSLLGFPITRTRYHWLSVRQITDFENFLMMILCFRLLVVVVLLIKKNKHECVCSVIDTTDWSTAMLP